MENINQFAQIWTGFIKDPWRKRAIGMPLEMAFWEVAILSPTPWDKSKMGASRSYQSLDHY